MADDGQNNQGHFSREVASYRDLLYSIAPDYHGRRGTIPLAEWREIMEIMFEAHAIPEIYRRLVAEQFLVGPAITYWHQVRGDFGPNPTMIDLTTSLANHFHPATAEYYWRDSARRFKQELGESIISFGFRFEDEIIATCPHPMTELSKMQLYQHCVRREYLLPRPAVPYGSYVDMRMAYDLIEDEDVLPHAHIPPAPVLPPVEAPVDPVDPNLADDPVAEADPGSDVESPGEDTDPTEYSADPNSEGHGEEDIEVDWDPVIDPAPEPQGDHPALAGPIIALDPEDIDLDDEDMEYGYDADIDVP